MVKIQEGYDDVKDMAELSPPSLFFDLKDSQLQSHTFDNELANVLDNLLRMSEGKEHATSLVDFIIMSMQIGSQT